MLHTGEAWGAGDDGDGVQDAFEMCAVVVVVVEE